MPEFIPETERAIIDLLSRIDFVNTHKELRITGSANSIGIGIVHKEPVMTEDGPKERIDMEVFPTAHGLREFYEISSGQGGLNGHS